jgi:hypothetical protein
MLRPAVDGDFPDPFVSDLSYRVAGEFFLIRTRSILICGRWPLAAQKGRPKQRRKGCAQQPQPFQI